MASGPARAPASRRARATHGKADFTRKPLVNGLHARNAVSTRRRIEAPETIALRPIELNALLQASAGGDPSDAAGQTVEMLPLDDGLEPEPDAELPTTEMIRIGGAPGPTRSTRQLRPLASSSAPRPVLARGSEPVRSARGTRRSREMLSVGDIRPAGGGRRGSGR